MYLIENCRILSLVGEAALGCVDALGLQIRCEGSGRFQGLGAGCVAEQDLACVNKDELEVLQEGFSYPHRVK